MHRHPISKEQLYFKRRDYRPDPIEPPESHPADFLIAVAVVVGLLTAIIVGVLERM